MIFRVADDDAASVWRKIYLASTSMVYQLAGLCCEAAAGARNKASASHAFQTCPDECSILRLPPPLTAAFTLEVARRTSRRVHEFTFVIFP